MSRRSLQGWVWRYNLEGLKGLREKSGRGHKPLLTDEERQLVAGREMAGLGPDEVCSLRGVDFQEFIQTRFGKRISLSAVYNLLHDLGYSWRTTEYIALLAVA